jgi:Coenzyme PQQ synthesis protein D (PqqD)
VAGISTQEIASFLGRLLQRIAGNSRKIQRATAGGSGGDTGAHGSRVVAPEVRASVHPDGLALLHIPSGRVFVCNRTGSRIWQGLVQGLSIDSISEEISRECGVARELVYRHTSSFLAELERRGLLTRRGAES